MFARSKNYLWVLLVLCVFYFETKDASQFVKKDDRKLKILCVFPHPGRSHFYVVRPLLEELARRGHDLTVISYFPRTNSSKTKEPLPNYKDISLVNEKYNVFYEPIDLTQIHHLPIRTLLTELSIIRTFGQQSCDNSANNPEVQQLLRSNEKFDLIFMENFNTDCFLGFVHKFKVPFVGITTCQIMVWTNDRIGNPDDAANIPAVFVDRKKPMGFLDRVANYLWIRVQNAAYDFWYDPAHRVAAEKLFGPDLPSFKDIARNQSALLANTHFSLHGARPYLPNVVEIGGIHLPNSTKPLPRDIKRFLDDAKEGVLYFSLGSMIKATSMPPAKLQTIFNVLRSIPRKVIWKWEADDLSGKPDNVFISRWLPQFDILHHPNVKAYLGHAGLLGLTEAVYLGVPMVLMPMYGDQFTNAAAAEYRGVAVLIEYEEINENILRHALDEIFNNTRYRENVKKLSKAFRDRPLSPMETAVWWIEYIGKGNDLAYIRSDAAERPWYQRQLIDVVLFLILLSLFIVYGVYRLFKYLLSFFVGVKGRRSGTTSVAAEKKRSKKRD
ncbi:hypothetical protein KPH14_003473 [Odynerus spinipes]|uniref:Glucuronosyltransferase n=1 Tax=Odynerus spinipes TaxID=1348599 RepID=A0AAD9VJX6_9HYME|nr:hypothetical protein KPH14_003473 [Odynerus spinipes]